MAPKKKPLSSVVLPFFVIDGQQNLSALGRLSATMGGQLGKALKTSTHLSAFYRVASGASAEEIDQEAEHDAELGIMSPHEFAPADRMLLLALEPEVIDVGDECAIAVLARLPEAGLGEFPDTVVTADRPTVNATFALMDDLGAHTLRQDIEVVLPSGETRSGVAYFLGTAFACMEFNKEFAARVT